MVALDLPRAAPEVMSELTAVGAVRLRTLLIIRWVALIGQAMALITVDQALGFVAPVSDCAAVITTSALLNLSLLITRSSTQWLSDREAALHLGFDLCQLAALLYLTGGIDNPFMLLLLAPITVSATILSLTSTLALSLLVAVLITVLSILHRPLPWAAGGFVVPMIYRLGLWTALVSATLFIAGYAWRVAAEARRMATALAATQMALARERQVSAVGALAAAAAHELGSPLGTIAVVARELANEVSLDSPWREDVDLLMSESARCREILARLAEAPDAERGGSPLDSPPLSVMLDELAQQHSSLYIEVEVIAAAESGSSEPAIERQPEILHGFGNLIANAVQFARSKVTVRCAWNTRDVTVVIEDDGPGFPPAILARLGDPYLSTRAGAQGHMGLGVFIATTLLGRTGASLSYANGKSGGASVAISWKRAIIDVGARVNQRGVGKTGQSRG